MPPSREGHRDRYKSLTPRENQARLAKREEVLCPRGAAESVQRLQGPSGIQAKQP